MHDIRINTCMEGGTVKTSCPRIRITLLIAMPSFFRSSSRLSDNVETWRFEAYILIYRSVHQLYCVKIRILKIGKTMLEWCKLRYGQKPLILVSGDDPWMDSNSSAPPLMSLCFTNRVFLKFWISGVSDLEISIFKSKTLVGIS